MLGNTESLEIEYFTFDSPEGKETFWHSSSHVMGQALGNQSRSGVFRWYFIRKIFFDYRIIIHSNIEIHYGNIQLCDGPAIQEGFFYEFSMDQGRTVSPDDFKLIEENINKILKKR